MSDTKPVKGVLLKTDGTRQDVTVSGWKDIVGHLGCDYMTVVPTPSQGVSAYVDDEGLLKEGTPVNIWSMWFAGWAGYNAPLVGNILLTGPTDDEGADTDLPADIIDQIPPTLRPDARLEFIFSQEKDEPNG